jgi:hypothetical protein
VIPEALLKNRGYKRKKRAERRVQIDPKYLLNYLASAVFTYFILSNGKSRVGSKFLLPIDAKVVESSCLMLTELNEDRLCPLESNCPSG